MKNKNDLMSQCEIVSRTLKAIAHPQRLKILCLLGTDELSVSEIEAKCEASQSSISQYLSKMKLEGLLESRRDGHHIYYRISSLELQKLMAAMQKIY